MTQPPFAPMRKSLSASSSHSTERSPLLQSDAPLPSTARSRTRRSSTTARPLLPPTRVHPSHDIEAQDDLQHSDPSRYAPDPNQYPASAHLDAIHDDDDERAALASTARKHNHHHHHDDNDAAASASTSVLPFPHQRDPAKPLRPDHYAARRRLDSARAFVARNQGLCLLATSQFFFSLMNLFYKLISSQRIDGVQIGALEIIFIRMAITWSGCIAYMLAAGVDNPFLGPAGVRGLLALRGFSGFFGLFGLYYSLQYLSLADATVITFLAPLATGFLGYLVLGERFTLREFLGGIASLGGVVLIARPAFIFGRKVADEDLDVPISPDALGSGSEAASTNLANEIVKRAASLLLTAREAGPGVNGSAATTTTTMAPPYALHTSSAHPGSVTEAERLLAVGLALLGICGAAGAYISIRAIGRRASATHSVAYFSLYSTLVSAVLMWYTSTPFVLPRDPKWCLLLICIGVFGLLAQILLAMGLQREKAGRASSTVYLQIVFASLYQLFILHVPINALSGVGMSIILAAAAWVAVAKD
ncbi:uncharacterized protein PFL1_02674 [Pseudozyma flocculosa PF-1]|uniref:EamA domain-containing protein n=1 Tax=Pseudozyma flocculosa PF-1 TaxID=1277687 RepID=A0A061HHC1_9BASI|nr:uncharacterized protein PFL1_02674 [Pseudozyma flocculosa PF-1]EPQ30001.1 hypothetical protein PFL1_02674 [Pseudozyma flocculosa PF-1]